VTPGRSPRGVVCQQQCGQSPSTLSVSNGRDAARARKTVEKKGSGNGWGGSMNINDISEFPSQKKIWDAALFLQEAYTMGARKVSEIDMPDDIRETVEKMMEFRKHGISIQ